MTLRDLIAVLDADIERKEIPDEVLARTVQGIWSDSRKIEPGGVFVALKGTASDGHRYVGEAAAKGCLAVVMEEGATVDGHIGPAVIRVKDSHTAYGRLAAAWHGHPAGNLTLVGITGTNGKTTTAWMLASILQEAGVRAGIIGTIEYRYKDQAGRMRIRPAALTTPDPMVLQQLLRDMVDGGITHVIMEVSSHALAQQRVAGLRFAVAVFTNLSRDHLDFHSDMEAYFRAKQLLFTRYLAPEGTGIVVLARTSADRDWATELIGILEADAVGSTGGRLTTCGLDSCCDIVASDLQKGLDGCRYILEIDGQQERVHCSLVGGYNVLNSLAAAGAAFALGMKVETIGRGIAACRDVPGRLERVRPAGRIQVGQPAVFVDYAHTPDALDNVLKTLRPLTRGRLICVFGCGGDRDRGKRPLMGEVAGKRADVVVLTSDNPRSEEADKILADIVPGVEQTGKTHYSGSGIVALLQKENGFAVIADRKQAIHAACSLAGDNDVVLVAGKGHETYQIVGRERRFFDDRLAATDGLLCWNRSHLEKATGGAVVSGHQATVFASVRTDSRKVQRGDIFVALAGDRFDGHDFIDRAVAAGAAAVIVHREIRVAADDVLVIKVEDTLKALGDLAAYRRRLLGKDLRVIAITGSSGKTTVKEMVAAIFSHHFAVQGYRDGALLKTSGNYNNLIGLPLSLLPVGASTRVAVLEMGMNRPGEIARLTEICDPDIGCINNVQAAHLEGLGSLEQVARAKGELFAGMRPGTVRVVNCDDPLVRSLPAASSEAIGFAVSEEGLRHTPLVRISEVRNLAETGMRCTLHIGGWRRSMTIQVPGLHNIGNCAAAAAICHAAGLEPESIVSGLEGFRGYSQRMEVVSRGALKVVNDCYNANPASMEAALRTVATFGNTCRHVAVLGDMLELGQDAEAAHNRIGALVAELGYDYLAVTGIHGEQVAAAARKAGMAEERVSYFAEKKSMVSWLQELMEAGALNRDDWLLIKGSRGMRMETLLEDLCPDAIQVQGRQ